MKNRFSDDHCPALKLRYLVPSILKQNGTKSIYDITEDLLQWKKDIPFPASLSIACYSLHIASDQKQNVHFHY